MRFFIATRNKDGGITCYRLTSYTYKSGFLTGEDKDGSDELINRGKVLGFFPANGMTFEQAESYALATLTLFPDADLYNFHKQKDDTEEPTERG